MFLGLEKAIQHGKERRRPYTGAKAVDRTCRNHGSCEWCRANREYANRKKAERMERKLKEWFDDGAR